MRGLIQLYLALLARLVIWKHRPRVIAVTGSVGKSTTKEAIAMVLRARFSVRSTSGNLNNEYGVPLSILGFGAPKGALAWLSVLIAAPFRALFSWKVPEVFVLEYGVDHPGDMDALLAIARPHVSVVTCVETVHLEHFPSMNELIAEKEKLARGTLPGGLALLNYDNIPTRRMVERVGVPTLTFGLNAKADFAGIDLEMTREGTTFIAKTPRAEKLPVHTKMLGKHVAYALLPALAVAEVLGIPGPEAVKHLNRVEALPGRLSLLAGTHESVLLDSTYNAEPSSMLAAIDVLREMPARRRIVVLGDMLELGARERDAHVELGRVVAGTADLAVLVGPRMEFAFNAIRNMHQGRMNAFHFMDRREAAAFLLPKVKPGDLILVKASQGMRLESVVRELLAKKADAEAHLVRQSPDWLRRPDLLGHHVG